MSNINLIDLLIKEGWLKNPEIIKAFKKIKRKDFLPEDLKNLSELNQALPIGFDQTISQPLVVAFMLEKLNPKKGEKILDIGSGSGWTTALLSEIVGGKGKIIAIELIKELMEFGRSNVEKYGFVSKGIASFFCADGSKGFKKEAPFDKILCSAAAQKEIPLSLKKQLKREGRIVIPINSSIWLFVKKFSAGGKDSFEEIEFPGFSFVPLIEK